MKTLRTLGALLAVTALLTFAIPDRLVPAGVVSVLHAQATTTQTTLAAAVTKSQNFVVLASATGIAKGYVIVADGEAMVVSGSYVSGTTVPVSRGLSGTAATEHASGAVVLAGPPSYFSAVDPVGPCTSTNETALPRVVLGSNGSTPRSVSVYNCQGASATTQRWQLYTRDGYTASAAASIAGTQAAAAPPTYTTAGAITLLPGVQYIGSAGALAMTLANPALYQNGTVMILQASTAQAHTVTYTAGFYGNTTSSDVCTFGGAIGDNLVIYAQNQTWRVLSTRNCTIA
jgi:hypothetical protein